jgi:hypothetical protein
MNKSDFIIPWPAYNPTPEEWAEFVKKYEGMNVIEFFFAGFKIDKNEK